MLEVPEVITEAFTIDELKANLADALKLILEVKAQEAMKNYKGIKTMRRIIMA